MNFIDSLIKLINCLNHYGPLLQVGGVLIALFISSRVAIRLSRRQHRTSIYIHATDNLASTELVKIEIAVKQLIKLSKLEKDKEFNDEIKLAFIKRLKKCPLDKYCESEMRTRLTYAQWILLWLHENCQNQDMDLDECDFTNQDFVIDNMKFANLFSRTDVKYSNLRFRNARICENWLDDADEKFHLILAKGKQA